MSDHTPGPLTVKHAANQGSEVIDACGRVVAILTLPTSVADRLRMERDAHHFAAAPDLLEALEDYTDCSPCSNDCDPNDMTCAFNKAKAAIAKARGDTDAD